MKGRALVGATGGLAGLLALSVTVSVGSCVLPGFGNRRGNGWVVFEAYPRTVATAESRLTMTGELEIVQARNVVESAAKGAGVCYGKGFKDVF